MSKRRNQPIWLYLILMIGLFVVARTFVHRQDVRDVESSQSKQGLHTFQVAPKDGQEQIGESAVNLKEWPLVDLPPPLPSAERPQTPVLFPVIYGHPSEYTSALEKRVLFLLEHHPSKDVRREMSKALGSKSLNLRILQGHSSSKAGFRATRPEDMSRIPPSWELDERGYYTYLFFHAPYVNSTLSEDEILRFWLTLEHEFQHYRDYRSESIEILNTIHSDSPDAFRTGCAMRWRRERKAYQQQCVQSESWGLDLQYKHPLCSAASSDEIFDQYMFDFLLRATNPPPLCQQIMAELAGHPHPAAFNPTH